MKALYIIILSVFLLIIFQVECAAQSLIINEILASNGTILNESTGEYSDWIELYNPSNKAVDIAGYYISDELEDSYKYRFPVTSNQTIIPPHGYLILWADDMPEKGPLHLNFKLSKDGEVIVFSNPEKGIVDSVTFRRQERNISYGRNIAGNEEWLYYTEPTPGKINDSKGYPSLRISNLIKTYYSNKIIFYFILFFIIALFIIIITFYLLNRKLKYSKEKLQLKNNEIKRLSRDYKTIINSNHDALFIISKQKDELFYTHINPAYKSLVGISSKEIINKNPKEVFGKTQGTQLEAFYRKCISSQEPLSYEIELDLPTVQKVIHTYLTPIIEGGEVIKIVGSTRDISSRKLYERMLLYNEKEYRELFEESPVGIVKIDKNGKIIDINKRMLLLTGATVKNQIWGKTLDQLITGKLPLKRIIRELEIGQNFTGEIYVNTIWDRSMYLEYKMKAIYDDSNNLSEVIVTLQDISEKKKREEQIKELTFKDSVTGLYNRNYFNNELKRYDVKRQLVN